MTFHGTQIAEGFISFKRRRRAQYGAIFGTLATGAIAAFSFGSFSDLIPINESGEIRTEEQRRSVLVHKLPLAIASFVLSAPLAAIAIRLKRISEDAHDLREEQRIGQRQWQATLYQPPSPKELQMQIPAPALPEVDPGPEELNINILMNASLLLIYGGQGSGKTTFARGLGFLRQSMGHLVKVADPHGAASRWSPWRVLGGGRKYWEVEQALKEFDSEVTRRYELYSNGVDDFPRETILCDELTQWASHVESASAFVASACSDIRKINLHVLLISHGDTINMIGGPKGFRQSFDGNAVKLHLESTLNPATGEYCPTGYGTLFVPGQEEQRIRVPDMRRYIVQGLPALQPQMEAYVLPSDAAIAPSALTTLPVADMPNQCIEFLEWLYENRSQAEEGYIPKRFIQMTWKPHQRGMKAEVFNKVLARLHDLGYIDYIEESPARIKLLRLPGGFIDG